MLRQNTISMNENGLILSGFQKKLKTMKKKFFVLYKETLSNVARLEYYDNEKKFKSGLAPKRVIEIKNCFNINRRLDTKYDNVIALSTKDGGFGIVFEVESEMLKWMEALLTLQRSDSNMSESFHPHFEHVWQVIVQRKGLAEDKGIVGYYHVCLTRKSITFIRIGQDKTASGDQRISNIEIFLTTIRRCGDSHCFFYMEVGRQSITGPGELWMETEDSLIAQNMHHMISSAMSVKGEINVDPMRKRSSSATEASKPVSVLQRRQTQPENKNSDSPQTNTYFGRERCDSLPSRNRTPSECSNHSCTPSSVSVYSIRNSNSTGLRSHSYQRHSNSPPMNYVTGCSESEESSISIDEPDDNGSFISYRFNSRSSDGVILEENTDELLNSENKYNDYNNKMEVDNVQENYVSMAPLKVTSDANDGNKYNNFKYMNSMEDAVSTLTRYSPKSEIKFPECTSDNISTNFSYETDIPSERPTRAYSIGSKTEHNKINKRVGVSNDSDQTTTRVRAFSVGSRAKIPRCDLQRGILFPKLMLEQNFNSNNNICTVNDVTPYNPLLNTNTYRDQKSTSAPLLIHKSHNSVDKMSDLMEIDFSKRANDRSNVLTKFSKGVPITIRDHITHNKHEEETLCTSTTLNKLTAHTDNGYLEMKPIGNLSNKNSSNIYSSTNTDFNETFEHKPKKLYSDIKLENEIKFIPIPSIAVLPNKRDDLGTAATTTNRCSRDQEIKLPADYSFENGKNSLNETPERNSDEKKINNFNSFNLSSKYSHLTLNSNSKKIFDSVTENDSINISKAVESISADIFNENNSKARCNRIGYNDSGKLAHSISDEDYTSDFHKTGNKSSQGKESGYEILQIKSDSSIQSNKLLNRPTITRKEKHQCQTYQGRPKSTNSSTLLSSSSSSSSTLCGCSSSSTSCLSNIPAKLTESTFCQAPNIKELNISNNIQNNISDVKPQPNVTSRPPSVSSEHELYYASLDLPQCTTEISPKSNKTDITNDMLSIVVSSANNAYAKIDFDHSDSSSSSSKNFNV